jgi:hypothetical protein
MSSAARSSSPVVVLVVLAISAASPTAGPGVGAASRDPRLGGFGWMAAPSRVDAPLSPTVVPRAAPGPSPAPAAVSYPLYAWPLAIPPGDDLVFVNYVDHDPASGILDYEGGSHAYDGHRGTDYTLLNFRRMDRGVPIVAAADGIVAYMGGAAPEAFDRSCGFSPPDDGNWLWVDDGGGSFSQYYHLRRASMTVDVGDPVQAGQLLGLVGSSGYSTAPHLHFEAGDYMPGFYQWRDPYTGPLNPLPSLWQIQDDYEGDRSLEFLDLGVFTDAVVGGSVFNTTYCDIQEGLQAPVVLGDGEPHLNIWVQFRGNTGDPFRIEVRHPDGGLWAWFEDTLAADARLDWFWAYWFWDEWVGPADHGTWTLRAYSGGVLSRETTFGVGAATDFGPRLRPAGRSFRIGTQAQRDTLRTTPHSPPVAFALIGAPGGVTLQDSILTVGTSSTQPTRSAFFQVVATDGFARSDTAWYHLVDRTKPLEVVTGVGDDPSRPLRPGLAAMPNPSSGPVRLAFELADDGRVRLELFDVSGRLVRRLLSDVRSVGSHMLEWNGLGDDGKRVAAGVYLARLTTSTGVVTRRVILSR